MSKKIEKKDPLLDNDGDDVGEDADVSSDLPTKAVKKEKASKAEKSTEKPTAKVAGNSARATLKAEAIAKFPEDIVLQTKYILDNSPKVQFVVPQVEGEFGEETVQINGYKLTIKKNVMVEIPVQVAQLIAEKYKINLELGKDLRIDRNDKTSEALS